jgi:DnaJ like chaperone protein
MLKGWNKWLWGGLGWTIGGPIGGIIGFALGSMADDQGTAVRRGKKDTNGETRPGDFGVVLLVLFGAVMKVDNRLLQSELEYVKKFFLRQFGAEHAKERMLLFREILKQTYSLPEVCYQVRSHLDYASKVQLLHMLFGLSMADGEAHPAEVEAIESIAQYLGVRQADYDSVRAMFIKDRSSAYKILEVDTAASDEEVKKAYRRMAVKFHPDKVHHLGPDFQKDAQEKFKKINAAYEEIKRQRGLT